MWENNIYKEGKKMKNVKYYEPINEWKKENFICQQCKKENVLLIKCQ